jgi:4'-phosphopantetheinyl transferase
VDLWYVRTSEVRGDDILAASEALLAPEERERLRGFRFDQHRHEYLVTRALCRTVLSTYVGLSPRELRFRRNAYGRPQLDLAGDLQFNLSNTVAMVVCAVDRGRQIGVDVEPLSRADEILEIAASVYTPSERERLDRLEHDSRREDAVRLWTLKEAYMKARGMGMAIAPESIQIQIESPRCRLDCVAANDDDPERWELSTRQIEDHVVGTCIERDGLRNSGILLRHANLYTMLARRSPKMR